MIRPAGPINTNTRRDDGQLDWEHSGAICVLRQCRPSPEDHVSSCPWASSWWRRHNAAAAAYSDVSPSILSSEISRTWPMPTRRDWTNAMDVWLLPRPGSTIASSHRPAKGKMIGEFGSMKCDAEPPTNIHSLCLVICLEGACLRLFCFFDNTLEGHKKNTVEAEVLPVTAISFSSTSAFAQTSAFLRFASKQLSIPA